MTETECIALKMGMFLFYAGPVRPTQATIEENRLLCAGLNNQSYVCEFGHCCGESHCCSYYYELWWFWLVWVIIIILSCCCICHHRRSKHRLQQQQRQHEINLIAYREARSHASLPFYFRFLPNYLLPEYEEVVNRPRHRPLLTVPCTLANRPVPALCRRSNRTSSASRRRPLRRTGRTPAPEELPPSDRAASAPERDGRKDPRGDSGSEGRPEDKDGPAGRHRRFTGDSGIEVCVCSGYPATEEQRELKGLLGDFCEGCDSCGQPSAATGRRGRRRRGGGGADPREEAGPWGCAPPPAGPS
ncbi:hypothetical protein ANANG_G00051720 [Anguilla anguilla]|uniref:WW domain binding protein 1-like b n=1 Tax=Anguilla anguilla TaxID=7936 RepID=A0A9D3MYJ6_ANGAN|nr:hypothetical protein ANANG_G00051720 [Anguilla anguilla]